MFRVLWPLSALNSPDLMYDQGRVLGGAACKLHMHHGSTFSNHHNHSFIS